MGMDEAIQDVRNGKTTRAAARDHDVPRTTLQRHLARAEIPDGYMVKGTSSLVDAEGNLRLQWIKMTADAEQQKVAMKAALAAMKEDIPKAVPVTPIQQAPSELLNQFTITDFHLGQLSWGEESGESYDTAMAEELLVNWFTAALAQAPQAEVGVLCQLGDFMHFDGHSPVTPTAHNVLDADTRFQKVVRVAVRVLRRVIDMMRQTYPKVHIIMADANHDPASGCWLREFISAMYSDDENVTVDTNPDTYYCKRWGDVALFYHHGHKKAFKSVQDVFVAKFREIYGDTKHAFAHTGHYHHRKLDETNLMILEQHRTLAASDAYSSRAGFMSGRSASVITYHKKYGEVGRITISPDMLK